MLLTKPIENHVNNRELFKSFLLTVVAFVTCLSWAYGQNNDPSADDGQKLNRVKKLDVAVRNQKVFLNFSFDKVPEYELVENLSRKVFTIKFRNTSLYKENLAVDFFNDLLSSGEMIRASDHEVWFLIRTKFSNLAYEVLPAPQGETNLTLSFERSEIEEQGVEEDFNKLVSVVQRKTSTGEEIVLRFSGKAEMRYDITSLPSFHASFVIENSRIVPDTTFSPFFSELIRKIDFIQSDNNINFLLIPFKGFLNIKISYRENPFRIVLAYKYQTPDQNFRTNEVGKYIQETRDKPNLTKLKQLYVKAEGLFRNGQWELAAKSFKLVYIAAPDSELGARSLFRAADAYHQRNLANPVSEGFSFVVQEYGFAVTNAENKNFKLPDLERAYFNIGFNYLKGKFYDLAEDYFKETIRRYPDSIYAIDSSFYLGVLFEEEEKPEQAIGEFEKLIETHPDSYRVSESLYHLGKNHFILKKYEKARLNFDRARNRDISLYDHSPEMLFSQAETYFEVNQFEKARSIYEKILDGFPDFPQRGYIIIRLGDYHRDTGQEKAALDTYELAINDSNLELSVIARMRIANMIAYHPNPNIHNHAIELYKTIIERFPEYPEAETAMLRLALTQSIHGEYGEAIKVYEDFRKKYPESKFNINGNTDRLFVENIKRLMEKFFYEGKHNAIVLAYNKHKNILTENPSFIPYLLVADAFAKTGDFQQANKILTAAASNYPPDRVPLAKFLLAGNFYNAKNYKKAIEILEEMKDDNFTNYYSAKSKILLGNSYAKINLVPEAIKVFDDFLEKTKEITNPVFFDFTSEVWFDLGEIYKELGRYEDALEAFKNSVDSYRHSVRDKDSFDYIRRAFFYIGDMNFELKEYENALRNYGRALSLYPEHERAPWAKYQTGYIYQIDGDSQQALDIYNSLIEEAGENPQQLWARFAIEGKREITLKERYKKHLEDPNNQIGDGS